MTHDSASRTIVSLVPEIEKKGAESVLLDYAERENLPPAQLEKLAQVFNTLRMLDHVDKSDDRGSSVNMVDVPTLVTDYVSRTKQATTLAPLTSRFSSHDPSLIDLMSAVQFDPQQVKAAAAPAAPATLTFSVAELQDLALDLEMDARIAMEKLAGELLSSLPRFSDGSLDMTYAIADARPLCNPAMLTRSVEWLKSASRAPLVGTAMDEPLVKRAFAITGEAGNLLVDFNYEFSAHQMLRKIAVSGVGQNPEDIMNNMTPEELEAAIRQHAIDGGVDPATLEDDPGAGGEEAPTPDFVTRGAPAADSDDEGAASPAAAAPAAAPSSSRMSKVLGALGAPVRAAGKAVSDAASAATTQIDRITSKDRTNKDQMKSDIDVEDVRRAIGLRRMIGTDPVLKESDPRAVLEIYNAISRTNPEIVHNMPALRLLLREAVNYEGLTLDSQKQLSDIRASSSKSEGQEADNLKRRYSVNGGGEPAKPKK